MTFSKTGKTLYYAGRTLAPLKGHGLKANYFDADTLEELWISGPRKDGRDSLYGATVEIDEDCREEYWRDIRGKRSLVERLVQVAGALWKSARLAREGCTPQEHGSALVAPARSDGGRAGRRRHASRI